MTAIRQVAKPINTASANPLPGLFYSRLRCGWRRAGDFFATPAGNERPATEPRALKFCLTRSRRPS